MQSTSHTATLTGRSSNAARRFVLLAATACLLAISIAAQNDNKVGQNSNQPPTRNYNDPATVGSQGNPAARTGALDRSTNTPGDYSGNHYSYPQPQRIYDGSKTKSVPTPPVNSSPSSSKGDSRAGKAN